MVSGELAGEGLQTGFSRHGLPPQRAPLDTVYPLREHLNSVSSEWCPEGSEGLFPDTVCWTRLRNTWYFSFQIRNSEKGAFTKGALRNFLRKFCIFVVSRGRVRKIVRKFVRKLDINFGQIYANTLFNAPISELLIKVPVWLLECRFSKQEAQKQLQMKQDEDR